MYDLILLKDYPDLNPENIKNIFKWCKRLPNVFKTHLNPMFWVTKRFQVNADSVMFKNAL